MSHRIDSKWLYLCQQKLLSKDMAPVVSITIRKQWSKGTLQYCVPLPAALFYLIKWYGSATSFPLRNTVHTVVKWPQPRSTICNVYGYGMESTVVT
jgi:hypothetical protein